MTSIRLYIFLILTSTFSIGCASTKPLENQSQGSLQEIDAISPANAYTDCTFTPQEISAYQEAIQFNDQGLIDRSHELLSQFAMLKLQEEFEKRCNEMPASNLSEIQIFLKPYCEKGTPPPLNDYDQYQVYQESLRVYFKAKEIISRWKRCHGIPSTTGSPYMGPQEPRMNMADLGLSVG